MAATRAGVVVVCAVALLAAACTLVGGDDEPNAEPPTPTSEANGSALQPPEEALRLFVQRRLNQGFVAECDDAQRPDDVGKQCGRAVGERDDMRAFELGPTFAEFTRLIILRQAGDGWTIAHLENRNINEPPVPGIPWPLQVGADVVVAGTDDCLRVRDRPGTQSNELACIDDGTLVTIKSGPVEIDSHQWWELEGYGWSSSAWLRYPDQAPVAPTATPDEDATPAPGESPTADGAQ